MVFYTLGAKSSLNHFVCGTAFMNGDPFQISYMLRDHYLYLQPSYRQAGCSIAVGIQVGCYAFLTSEKVCEHTQPGREGESQAAHWVGLPG